MHITATGSRMAISSAVATFPTMLMPRTLMYPITAPASSWVVVPRSSSFFIFLRALIHMSDSNQTRLSRPGTPRGSSVPDNKSPSTPALSENPQRVFQRFPCDLIPTAAKSSSAKVLETGKKPSLRTTICPSLDKTYLRNSVMSGSRACEGFLLK